MSRKKNYKPKYSPKIKRYDKNGEEIIEPEAPAGSGEIRRADPDERTSFRSSRYYEYGEDEDYGDYGFGFGSGITYGKSTKGEVSTGYSGYSGYWLDRFGGLDWSGWSSGDSETLKYQDALYTIARTANLVENKNEEAGKTDERFINVRWSDGRKVNSITDSTVYLSPDAISSKHRKEGWTDQAVVDVLVGEALQESAYKANASPKAEKQVREASGSEIKKMLLDKLWYTAESMAAQDHVIERYPGFNTYFRASKTYATDPTQKAFLQSALDGTGEFAGSKPSTQKAAAATYWNMLQPDDPLTLPPVYQEAVEGAVKRLREAKTSQARADATFETMQDFERRWRLVESRQDLPGAGPEGTDANGNSVPGPPKMPRMFDLKKMGMHNEHMQQVSNGTGLNLSHQTGKCGEDGDDPGGIGDDNGDEELRGDVDVVNFSASPSEYREYLTRLSPHISALRNRLKIRNEETSFLEHGLKSGQIDEGSLYKLGFVRHGLTDNGIFESKEIVSQPDMAFGILVDESGSMSGGLERGTSSTARSRYKYDLAKEAAIIIANALKGFTGIQLAVAGHTAQTSARAGFPVKGMVLHHYHTPKTTTPNFENLALFSSFGNNLDGYAIKKMTRYMADWYAKVPVKILIHISDGYPAGSNYGGTPSYYHVQRVCQEARRKKGVRVIAIGIDKAGLRTDVMNVMYGGNNWALLESPEALATVVSNLITRAIKEAGKL